MRDAVLIAANAQRNPQRQVYKMQDQMAAKLKNAQTAGDEEVRAALVQLLNDESEAVSCRGRRLVLPCRPQGRQAIPGSSKEPALWGELIRAKEGAGDVV